MSVTIDFRVEKAFQKFRDEKKEQAENGSLWDRVKEKFDSVVRTDAVEFLDRADYPEEGKQRIVQGVHIMNVTTFSYQRFLSYIKPIVDQVVREEGRKARILEIAGGTGGFALSLAKLVKERNLQMEITGSDIVPLYVETAKQSAKEKHLEVEFIELNAMNMQEIEDNAYDIIFVAQSMHHFQPGQLGAMLAESERVATKAFVGIDGTRSLFMLFFVIGTSLLSFHPPSIHDATVTARKFYASEDLDLIAQTAVAKAKVTLARLWPFNTVLDVRFGGGKG